MEKRKVSDEYNLSLTDDCSLVLRVQGGSGGREGFFWVDVQSSFNMTIKWPLGDESILLSKFCYRLNFRVFGRHT